MTSPFWKPFRPAHVLLSWLVPVFPLVIAWDGLVSCLRVYSPEELTGLIQGLDRDYQWAISRVPLGGSRAPRATCLVGIPLAP